MTFNNKEYIQWKKAQRNKKIGLKVGLTALGIGGGVGIGYGIWHAVTDTYLSVKYDVMFFKWDESASSSLPTVKGNNSNKTATNLKFSLSDPSKKPTWLELNESTGQLTVPIEEASLEDGDANQWFVIPIDVKGKIGDDSKDFTGHYDAKIHISEEEPYLLTDFFDTHKKAPETLNFFQHRLTFSQSQYNGGGLYYSIPLYSTYDENEQNSTTEIASIDKYKDGSNRFYGIKYKNSDGTWNAQQDFARGKNGEEWFKKDYLIQESMPTWMKGSKTSFFPSFKKPFREYDNHNNVIDSSIIQADNGPFDQTIFHWYESAEESMVPSVLKAEQTVNKVSNNIYIPTKTKENE
jgi:hypothetical protein